VSPVSLRRGSTTSLFAAIVVAAVIAVMFDASPVAGSFPGENGEILVFGSVDRESGLYLVDLDPLSIRKLPIEAHDLDLYSAAWSPTGSHIAFTRFDAGDDSHGLWIHDMDSGQTRLLRYAESGSEYTDLSWSPSGDEIVVGVDARPNGSAELGASLERTTLDGDLIERISLPSDFVWFVEWSPNGSEILLDLHWRGVEYIWDTTSMTCLLSVTTRDIECITDAGLWPSWSPDGRQILLGLGPTSDLHIIDRTGKIARRFPGTVPGRMTQWSPDGKYIAYPSYQGEPEVGHVALEVFDLATDERHGYVVGISNILDLEWRPLRPASGFLDVPDTHVFAKDVAWLATEGITLGCNAVHTEFCPTRPVTRQELAAFLHRAMGDQLAVVQTPAVFLDIADSPFEADIAWLSSTGITRGCNPPANDRFCPEELVRRGELAAFLVRALGYTDPGAGDLFIDDDTSIFEGDIDRLATAGVTKGCNPPTNDRFCPKDYVTRGQMAAFLHRPLD